MLKCSRYVFTYTTPPDEVEDFILRSDDLAAQTYGRDKFFSRLNQVLDQARFMGWPLPRFGPNLPDELTEIPPPGVNHIFENQAKLLVDIAPVTRVLLEDGKYCPVRMVCGTTAAGDLIWKCHLLLDQNGTPFVQRHNRQLHVKTKGTKIVCQTETLPFDEKYMFECFGGEEAGIWPVPFLPEFFSDQPIAQKFSPEAGVIEVVRIQEEEPVFVFARELVPWYRPLEIDRSKALAFDDELYTSPAGPPPTGSRHHFAPPTSHNYDEEEEEEEEDFDAEDLVEGWDDVNDDETFDLNEEDDNLISLVNLVCPLTKEEELALSNYDSIIANNNISSKAEAEELRKDPKHKERAETWLVAAVNRLGLLANHSKKMGALVSVIEKNRGRQILILQPRLKWAEKAVDVLRARGTEAALYNPKDRGQTSRFYEGNLKILVTNQPREELFIEDLIIVSMASFVILPWLDWLNSTQTVYTLPTKQLGYTDFNFVPEHPMLDVESEEYNGPELDILQTKTASTKPPKVKAATAVKENNDSTAPKTPKTPKPKTPASPKYKVKTGKGRPKSATSYEKALEIAQKLEAKGQSCEILSPDGKDTLYSTGMPKQLQGELE